MNRRDFCRAVVGGTALLAIPIPAIAKESPEETVQRLIDNAPRNGFVKVPRRTYLNPSWTIRKGITLDLNGSTVLLQKDQMLSGIRPELRPVFVIDVGSETVNISVDKVRIEYGIFEWRR